MTKVRSFFMQNALAWLVVGAFGLVVLFVNPLRETATDDDWVYAWTVRHLLETGKYQLHAWAAPNMPFQAYWGGLFARLLGYSFSSLRISTLFLSVLGLIAFYYLANEHGLDETQAGLLTLGLLASPLFLRFSFTFMTDVPFLAFLIIALYFYTRAIRLHSYPLMLLASVAASAAILTRQIGVALIAGLFFEWVLSKARKRQAVFFLTGLAFPVVAALWQLSAGILRPTWGAELATLLQSQYFASPGVVLTNALWRPTVMLQYLALFSLPFAFLAVLASVLNAFSTLHARRRRLLLAVLVLVGLAMSTLTLLADWIGIGRPGFGLEQALMLIGAISLSVVSWWLLRSSRGFSLMPLHTSDSRPLKLEVILVGAFALYILVGILYGRSAYHLSALMPYIGWYLFGILRGIGRFARGILTLITSMGAIWLGSTLVLRHSGSQSWRRIPPWERLLDWVALFLLLQNLVWYQLADEYFLAFLPLTLILMGRQLGKWLNRHQMATVLACLAMLVASAMWTRGLLASSEACWRGAEFVLSTGAQPNQVYGCEFWFGYYRFYDYVAEVPDPTVGFPDDFFGRWMSEQRQQAQFWVTETLYVPTDEKWEVLKEIPYRDILLREGRVYVLRRQGRDH